MNRFPHNDIVSLVDSAPRHDLGESYGPNLQLDALLDDAGWAELGGTALGYGTLAGDAASARGDRRDAWRRAPTTSSSRSAPRTRCS